MTENMNAMVNGKESLDLNLHPKSPRERLVIERADGVWTVKNSKGLIITARDQKQIERTLRVFFRFYRRQMYLEARANVKETDNG